MNDIEKKLVELEDSKHDLKRRLKELDDEANKIIDIKNTVALQLNEIIEKQRELVHKNIVVRTSIGSFFWKKTTACVITDKESIPDEYLKVIPSSTKIDKYKVKKDIEHGNVVPGAEIETNYNFQIKLKKG